MCFILIQKRVLLIVMAFLATACATPKTAEEFRQATRSGTPLTTAESIEVERSFKDVTATLRKKTNECLAMRVDRTCVPGAGIKNKGVGRSK